MTLDLQEVLGAQSCRAQAVTGIQAWTEESCDLALPTPPALSIQKTQGLSEPDRPPANTGKKKGAHVSPPDAQVTRRGT